MNKAERLLSPYHDEQITEKNVTILND